jgi:hypothetical protein
MLTGANARVEGKLDKAHIIDLVGRDNFFKTFLEAMEVCRQLEVAAGRTASRC